MIEDLPIAPKPERRNENPLSPFQRRLVILRLTALEIGERINLQIDKVRVGARIAVGGEVGKARAQTLEVRKALFETADIRAIRNTAEKSLKDRLHDPEFREVLAKHDNDPSLLYEEELNGVEEDTDASIDGLVSTFDTYDVNGRLRADIEKVRPLVDTLFRDKEDAHVRERFNVIADNLEALEETFGKPLAEGGTPNLDSVAPERNEGKSWTFKGIMEGSVSETGTYGRGSDDPPEPIPVPTSDSDSAQDHMRSYKEIAPQAERAAFLIGQAVKQLRVAVGNKRAALASSERRYPQGKTLPAGGLPPKFNEPMLAMRHDSLRARYTDLSEALHGLDESIDDFRNIMTTLESAADVGLGTHEAITKAREQLAALRELHAPIRNRRETIRKIRTARTEVETKGKVPPAGILKPRKRRGAR